MSKKTISTGTLSLRFMQNAHRAQNLAQVELDKAEVHDDGKWEVGEEVKQAWGLTVVPERTVTYEQSYLPFLFPENSSGSRTDPTGMRGRRTFKGGKEVIEEPPPPVDPAQTDADADPGPSDKYKRPQSISAAVSSRGHPPKPTTTAREMIRGKSDVGTDFSADRRGKDLLRDDSDPRDVRRPSDDLPSNSEKPAAPAAAERSVFLKPSGVDDLSSFNDTTKTLDPSSSHSAPSKTSKRRERDPTSDLPHSEGKKRKKKKERE